MKQFSQEQAVAIFEDGEWKDWTPEEIVKVQLFQDRLCLPFDIFHQAVEQVFGRPVWTHEFANQQRLIDEYLGDRPMPTLEEIIALIPEEKRIITFGLGDTDE